MNINAKIDELKSELIDDTQKLIRIKSVKDEGSLNMPFGSGINDALLTVLNIGKKMGFRTKNIDGYMGYIEYGEGEEIAGVLGHLDVVPEGDGWNYPAYGAEIHDDKIYGRGTLDDKGPMIASLYALYALKETGFKPNKRIRILFGTDEENGCGEIDYYLKREEKFSIGFTPDGCFPIIFAEKGITFFNIVKEFSNDENRKLVYIKGGHRPNMVPDYCEFCINDLNIDSIIQKINDFKLKTGFDIKYELNDNLIFVKSYGISAHGSTPEKGKNAIMQAVLFIQSLGICSGEIGDAIDFFANNIGIETNGRSFGVYLRDDVSGELSFNVGTIELKDNKISLGLNLRYPVTSSFEEMKRLFDDKIEGTGFRIEDMQHQKPLYFPKDHKLIKILSEVYTEITGEKPELLAIGGGTYAKEMTNIVAFGPIFPGKPDLDHQANECIEIDDLIKITKIYALALKKLSI